MAPEAIVEALSRLRDENSGIRQLLADQNRQMALLTQSLELSTKAMNETLNRHDATLYGPDGGGGLVHAVHAHDKLAADVDAIKRTAGKAMMTGVGSIFAIGAKWIAEHLTIK